MRFYSFLGSLIFAQGCGDATAGDSVPQLTFELTTDMNGAVCSGQPPFHCCPPDYFAAGLHSGDVVCVPEY